VFRLHLQREQERAFRSLNVGEVGACRELVGRADQLTEGQRRVGYVPAKTGSGDAAALDQRDQSAAQLLLESISSNLFFIPDKLLSSNC
jgi:hypothetical protein